MPPIGQFRNYTGSDFAAVVYSHLTGCGGADPGRRCGGSPCLSHCSLSAHEFPLDCPKLVILLLYAHGYIYTVIHTHTEWTTSSTTWSTPSTSWKCLMQTLNMTDHEHNITQAQTGKGKQQRKKKKEDTKHTTTETDATKSNNSQTNRHKQTHKLLNPKYLLHRPHMQQNQRNSGIRYQYSVRRNIILQRQCGWCYEEPNSQGRWRNCAEIWRKEIQ